MHNGQHRWAAETTNYSSLSSQTGSLTCGSSFPCGYPTTLLDDLKRCSIICSFSYRAWGCFSTSDEKEENNNSKKKIIMSKNNKINNCNVRVHKTAKSEVQTSATAEIWIEISASCTPRNLAPGTKNGSCAGSKPVHEERVDVGV